MPDGPTIILCLKVAVTAVTLLLVAAFVALVRGHVRWHGRLNVVSFVLTMLAVLGFEVLVRLSVPVTAHFTESDHFWLRVHLCCVIPLVPVMVAMLVTGLRHRRAPHLGLAGLFALLWVGMLVTGFLLPHTAP